MKRVKATTKKGQRFIAAYANATSRSVKDFYKTASYAKISAENSIIYAIDSAYKHTYRVIAGNSSFFTAAYQSDEGLVVETPANTYIIM